jgi:LysM repeat protein
LGWLALVLLAGCFQQAGESLQSAGNTAEPIPSLETTPTSLVATTSDSQAASPTSLPVNTTAPIVLSPGAPTLPPITIIVQPTRSVVTATPAPPTEVTSETTNFITPGIPLGPGLDNVDDAADSPAATPSGLITPTAFSLEDGPEVAVTTSAVEIDPACSYTVQPGDTVYRIALRNNTSVDAMRQANPELTGDNPIIQPGQVLALPDCDPNAVPVVDEEPEPTMTDIAPIITPAGQPPASAPAEQEYVVQPGDTLYLIAQRFGVTISAIVQANNLSNPNRLSIGQRLIIPGQ